MNLVCIATSDVPSSKANSIQVMKACHALAHLGHEVTLLVPAAGASSSSASLKDFYGLRESFPVEWLASRPQLRRYDFAWAAVRRARRLRAEVLYTWTPQVAMLALVAGLPVLYEMHGPPEGSFGPALFRLFLRLPGKKRLLPITRALAHSLDDGYALGRHLPASEIVLAPNGIDLAQYQDVPGPVEARRLLGMPEGLTAGYTGHLYPGRGIALLADLARHFKDVHFLWVGGRLNEVDAWKAWAQSEGLRNLTITGFIEHSRLPLYQAAADILLMPYERAIAGSSGGNSASYASPMKMFDYMACGRAILSSDLPVIREVLNETNAVLCPPEDLPAWEQALAALLADPARREALARQAHLDVRGYTWLERARRILDGFGNGAERGKVHP